MADSDLQIRGKGGRSFRPRDKGVFLKIFFRPFRPQFGPKITGKPRTDRLVDFSPVYIGRRR